MPDQQTEIAVIGAGAVGLAVALRLSRAGHEVSLMAPQTADEPASEGNAGIIADYAVLPVGTPEVLRDLPRLLVDRKGPVSLRLQALPALAPWMLRFLRQSMPAAARRNAAALATILAPSAPAWRELADEIGAAALLRQQGLLYLFDTPGSRRGAEEQMARKRALGVNAELISSDELGQLEPALPRLPHGAAFYPDTMSVTDPRALMRELRAAVAAAGVARIPARATGLIRRAPGDLRIAGQGETGEIGLRAGRVVIAAGAWSRPLARAAGDRIALDTERGYHLEFDMPTPPLTRPAMVMSRGFGLSPMTGRLRAAGTVEFGGLSAPPSPHRLQMIETAARNLLPELAAPSRSWLGFRPSVPDSVPVIGPSRGGDDVLLAFGHGHLGLTLAPITARIIADMVAGRAPEIDPSPYAPSRF